MNLARATVQGNNIGTSTRNSTPEVIAGDIIDSDEGFLNLLLSPLLIDRFT